MAKSKTLCGRRIIPAAWVRHQQKVFVVKCAATRSPTFVPSLRSFGIKVLDSNRKKDVVREGSVQSNHSEIMLKNSTVTHFGIPALKLFDKV